MASEQASSVLSAAPTPSISVSPANDAATSPAATSEPSTASVNSGVNTHANPGTKNGRAKRVKRESGRKKKEPKGADGHDGHREKRVTMSTSSSAIPPSKLTMLMPMLLPDPRQSDVLPPRPRQFTFARSKRSDVLDKTWDFYEITDKLSNKNGFRYTYASADPVFPRIRYRQSDPPPYHARFSFEDSPTAFVFTEDGLAVTTSDPWHSARANVCAREGTHYFEARVISGIVKDAPPGAPRRGNVRLGFSRREADLDVNVGVDSYGYGIRDVNGEVVNRMRCEYFFPKGESINEGDVVGMLITLPPLSLHQKIVEGTYDPVLDGDGTTPPSKAKPSSINYIRDRIPFHLKSDFLYQQSHIFPSKNLRDYAFNLKEAPGSGRPSPFNAEDPSLRTLPGSNITFYKNGKRMGTPFTNLFAFLPPASRATQGSNNIGIGERENADDGMIGYFPTASCYGGGAVECRFEAPWWYGPPTADFPDVRPFGDRFNDQIVEDIVADIVDEIEATFAGWSADPMLPSVPAPAPAPAPGFVPASGADAVDAAVSTANPRTASVAPSSGSPIPSPVVDMPPILDSASSFSPVPIAPADPAAPPATAAAGPVGSSLPGHMAGYANASASSSSVAAETAGSVADDGTNLSASADADTPNQGSTVGETGEEDTEMAM